MKKTKGEIFRFLWKAEKMTEEMGSSLGKGFVWPAVIVDDRDDVCAVLWEADELDDEKLVYAVFLVWRDRQGKYQWQRAAFERKVADIKIKSAKQAGKYILVEINPPNTMLIFSINENEC